MLRYDEQVHHSERFQVVVHQKQVRIVARGNALTFGLVGTVRDRGAELAFLAFEFELLLAPGAEKVGERSVVGKLRHFGAAAVRAIGLSLDPGFRPGPCLLGTTGIRCLRL